MNYCELIKIILIADFDQFVALLFVRILQQIVDTTLENLTTDPDLSTKLENIKIFIMIINNIK